MENKTNEIYRGKAKIVYNTANADHVIIEYTDQATAFNGVKKENIAEKGHLNADITSHIYRYLESKGIPTHFIDAQDKEILAKKLNIILVEVVVRNIVAGSDPSCLRRFFISSSRLLPSGKVMLILSTLV